jgi:hypothetical protein
MECQRELPPADSSPCGAKTRDVRLDAMRGLLLVIMAAVHVPTPLSRALHEPFGFTSVAEGFVFLGACLAGCVYGKTYASSGWAAMSRRVWARAKVVYVMHIGVVMPMALLAWTAGSRVTGLANQFHDFLQHPWGSLALMPLLLHQPPLFDILPLYVVLLAATPLVIRAARRAGWTPILALSAVLWLAAQFKLDSRLAGDPARWLPVRWSSFNLLSWQFLWVAGLATGEAALRHPIIARRYRGVMGICAGAIVLAGLLARHGLWPDAWFSPDLFLWMDKWTLGPLRLLNFGAWVVFLVVWNPPVPGIFAPLALLGRHSLAVFTFHIPLVVGATLLIDACDPPAGARIVIGFFVIALLFPWAAWQEWPPASPAPAPAPQSSPAAAAV